MDIKIVPMMQDDVPQVAALEAACFSDPWSAQILSNELQNELSLWLVAKDGDTVLGYVGSQSVLDEAARRCGGRGLRGCLFCRSAGSFTKKVLCR